MPLFEYCILIYHHMNIQYITVTVLWQHYPAPLMDQWQSREWTFLCLYWQLCFPSSKEKLTNELSPLQIGMAMSPCLWYCIKGWFCLQVQRSCCYLRVLRPRCCVQACGGHVGAANGLDLFHPAEFRLGQQLSEGQMWVSQHGHGQSTDQGWDSCIYNHLLHERLIILGS